MTEISRIALFGKLNKLGYQAVESATVFCKMRGNPYVELVHWMHQILAGQDSDLHRIVAHYDLDPGKIAAEMTRALDMLPRGASTISDLSDHLMDAMERGWVQTTILTKITIGYELEEQSTVRKVVIGKKYAFSTQNCIPRGILRGIL